jgi:hypothetical protein
MRKLRLFPILALLHALLVRASGVAGTDAVQFLVVERPDRLVLLNRYQQNLSASELALFRPFAPLKVLNMRDHLGDGFTPCMRVELEGGEYFVVRETDGRLSGELRAGRSRTYMGTALSRDTVQVLARGLRFVRADGSGGTSLSTGEKLIRVFSANGMTYVLRRSNPPSYGWVALTPAGARREWQAQHGVSMPHETGIPGRVRDSVQAALARTNVLLAHLYSFFSQQTGRPKEAPQWHLEASSSMLRCTLMGGSPERDFPESTRYLVRDIETFVLGTGLGVYRLAERIEIR